MNIELKHLIQKYALQNALKFEGKANPGAVIGKLFAQKPELKKQAKDLGKSIAKEVAKINSLSLEKQKEKLIDLGFTEEIEKVDDHLEHTFDFLKIRPGEKVVTCYPPEPSKYPHIGHAKAIVMNYELAKDHQGDFILRFEDTNPDLAEKEFYDIHLENYKWLGIKHDKLDYASDHMDKFYDYAKKLLKDNNAYVCTCTQETISDNRFKGEECQCRYNLPDKNNELWEKMQKAKPGKMVLRLKGYMESINTTMRDPAIMRVITTPHTRTKSKYRVWPTYDFENAVMDGLNHVTHRLRSKEFELREEPQELLQNMLKFKRTKVAHFARFNLEGVESSGRKIRELVQKKKLLGWDDPSLTTLVALRRRGFLPKAIREFVRSTGLSKAESVLTWDDLIAHNKRLLDPECNRYFFIEDPKPITITNSPKQEIEIKLHPDFDRGKRKFTTKTDFYITKEDYKAFKHNKLYRLMDCVNFKKIKNKFVFDSTEHEKYKKKGDKIIHWLPHDKNLVKIEILMPDKSIKKGLAEPSLKDLKVGESVQLVRTGFVKLDKKEKSKLVFWFTHN